MDEVLKFGKFIVFNEEQPQNKKSVDSINEALKLFKLIELKELHPKNIESI